MIRRLDCWLNGHIFARATQGLTGVAGKPVFVCRCGAEWIVARGWFRSAIPTKRD